MAKKKTGLYSGMMDIQIYQVYKKTLDEFLRSSDMNLNNKNVVYTIPIYQRRLFLGGRTNNFIFGENGKHRCRAILSWAHCSC